MKKINNKIDLEDFINDNKSLFDTEVPKNGHFERFQMKLNSQEKPKRLLYNVLKYAAAVIFLISTFFIYENYLNINNKEIITENEIDIEDDFSDVSNFYSSRLDAKFEEFNSVSCKNVEDQKQKQIIQDDIDELKNEYNELMIEYKLNPNNNLIKNALISNYRLRIDTLGRVINNLKKYC